MSYLVAIKTAVILFPIIALLFTVPFILHQYHKYGSINSYRVLIVYSFILYMICIYFLVILPLPNREEVTKSVREMMRLVPFSFVGDFLRESSLVVGDPRTYLRALTEPCVYTVVFNVLMCIPFGMYLRYYFECSFKRTLILTFCLSLFFELTQLSGLYFIYPHPYRLFDVDDLIVNTLGGIIGYLLMGWIGKILPTREDIDKKSLSDGMTVSGLRRFTLFTLDLFLYGMISMFFRGSWAYKIIFLLYYIFIPICLDGKTLGGKFLNVKVEFESSKITMSLFRIIFVFLYYFFLPMWMIRIADFAIVYFDVSSFKIHIHLITLFMTTIFYMINFFYLIKNKYLFYDKIFRVSYKSTIVAERPHRDDIS